MPIDPKSDFHNIEALASNIVNQTYSLEELKFLIQTIKVRKLLLSSPSTPEEAAFIKSQLPKVKYLESLLIEHYPELLL